MHDSIGGMQVQVRADAASGNGLQSTPCWQGSVQLCTKAQCFEGAGLGPHVFVCQSGMGASMLRVGSYLSGGANHVDQFDQVSQCLAVGLAGGGPCTTSQGRGHEIHDYRRRSWRHFASRRRLIGVFVCQIWVWSPVLLLNAW